LEEIANKQINTHTHTHTHTNRHPIALQLNIMDSFV